jgi:pilus assembly protein CpaB
MDRRRILLVVAVLVAAVGSALVFLYTKGADTRAEERFDTVEVLEATAVIAPGETFEDAQAAGKLALQAVSKDALLDGYQTTTDSLAGTVSLGTIYPGEQIISAKWGTSAAVTSTLQIPDANMAVSVNLTDQTEVAADPGPMTFENLFK